MPKKDGEQRRARYPVKSRDRMKFDDVDGIVPGVARSRSRENGRKRKTEGGGGRERERICKCRTESGGTRFACRSSRETVGRTERENESGVRKKKRYKGKGMHEVRREERGEARGAGGEK